MEFFLIRGRLLLGTLIFLAYCMVSHLYNQHYDILEAPSETIDAALHSKDEAWDKVSALQKQIKELKAELAASKKSGKEVKREFADKLAVFENAKKKETAEKDGLANEVAGLAAKNKKLALDLAKSKSEAVDYYQQLFNLR